MNLPQSKTENLAQQTAGEETMIYDLVTDRAYLLNETSAFVWQMCDGKTDVMTISRALAEKNDQPVNEDIVKLAIDKLRENNLMNEETPKFFSQTTRRKMIKQIGLITMIALPAIFSLTAPTAAHAFSGRACRATNVCYPKGTPYCLPNCTGRHDIYTFDVSDSLCTSEPYETGAFVNCFGASTQPSVYPFKFLS